MEAVSETSGSDAPDTIRTCESFDGIFVDDGPLAEQFVVRGEIAIFRPWLKWWVSVWKSRKCFVLSPSSQASQLEGRTAMLRERAPLCSRGQNNARASLRSRQRNQERSPARAG
jgi:hypothetical protein